MKCTLHIYIVPSVDWYHHWRNRWSSFGGEANTNYLLLPSAKIICDERTNERTNGRKDGHTDYYMDALRGHNYTIFEVVYLNEIFINLFQPFIFFNSSC